MKSFKSEIEPAKAEELKLEIKETNRDKHEQFISNHQYMNKFSNENPFKKDYIQEMTERESKEQELPVEGCKGQHRQP